MREINYWNNKENCIVEAKKYDTITELQKHCYDRIWDCGLIKYVYTNPNYKE